MWKRRNRRRTLTLAWISMGMLAACSGKVTESEITGSPEAEFASATALEEESEQEESSKALPASDVVEFTSLLTGDENAKLKLEHITYYVGERCVIWMEQGVSVPENLPQMIEEIMAREEELLGIRYEDREYAENGGWISFYFGDDFRGIDCPEDKVNILLQAYKDDGAVAWSDTNELLLFDEDFDPELESGETVYHELAHALRLRQSPKLGQVVEEGIATYAQWKLALKRNTPCWNMIQYVNSDLMLSDYDESAILKDPEQAFRDANLASRDAGHVEYQYGIRFITFLEEAYGSDVIRKLGEAAAKRSFSEEDNDAIIAVIREATSEDVFERFGAWIPEGWKKNSDDIIESLKPFGL